MELRSKSSAYKIQKVLSEGEDSTVCEAYRKDLNYPIAQKVLLKIFKNKSQAYPLELDSLIKVQSPYCVSVLNFETIENKPAFILEWVTGLNLFQLLRQSDRINPLEISYICWNVQQGLVDLRRHGICHGDLSCSNILIDQKGNVRLIDFGKGNYTDKNIFTTPSFTAPEVSQGSSPSFYSDLFSLGVLEIFLNHPLQLWNEDQWGSSFAIPHDPLLDPSPQKRKLKEFTPYEEGKLSLAQKVQSILKKQNKLQIPSLVSSHPPASKKLSKVCSIIMLFIFFFIGHSPSFSMGSISIRSHQWFHIKIENQEGFTPFHSGLLPTGNYLLKWKTSQQAGSILIEITKNSHLLLTDRELISPVHAKK